MFGKRVVVTIGDFVLSIVLSKGVQDYFKETYGRETHFIPNGVNRPQIREASLIKDKFGLKKTHTYCSSVVWYRKRAFDIWLRPSRMSRRIKNWLLRVALAIRIPLWWN